jgi:NADP-dependent 3-hydroxy acid dehydrogenase YdfG
MKIAITGHSKGIGQALANKLQDMGHTIVGFSRSNGYDVTAPGVIEKIVLQSAECDMFINNAPGKYAQAELVYEMANKWQGQQKTIVCITSRMAVSWTVKHPELGYRNTKKALDLAVEHVRNMWSWPRVCLVRPPSINTERSAWVGKQLNAINNNNLPEGDNGFKQMEPDEFADILVPMLFHKRIFTNEIWISAV